MTDPRFTSAEHSPRYAELMQRSPPWSLAGSVLMLAFLALFTGVSAVMTVLFLVAGPLALAPLAGAVFGAVLFVKTLAKVMRISAAPIERLVALVREENTEVSSRHTGRRRAYTRHYVTLETRSGERSSHQIRAELAQLVVPGDLGIAYLKGGELLDFQRL